MTLRVLGNAQGQCLHFMITSDFRILSQFYNLNFNNISFYSLIYDINVIKFDGVTSSTNYMKIKNTRKSLHAVILGVLFYR